MNEEQKFLEDQYCFGFEPAQYSDLVSVNGCFMSILPPIS